jgi:hypothetical protein
MNWLAGTRGHNTITPLHECVKATICDMTTAEACPKLSP